MADENKTQEPQQQQFDPQSLKPVMAEAVAEAIRALQQQQQQPEPVEEPQLGTVGKVIRDEVGADIAQAQLLALDAGDKADFYTRFPEARRYQSEVETKSRELMQAGRPMDRESIWYWYKGRNEEKLLKDRQADEEQQKQRAREAAIVAGQSPAAGGFGQPADPWAMSPEELERSLANVSF